MSQKKFTLQAQNTNLQPLLYLETSPKYEPAQKKKEKKTNNNKTSTKMCDQHTWKREGNFSVQDMITSTVVHTGMRGWIALATSAPAQ